MFSSPKKLNRLGQWTGRKHSTRRDEPLFRRLTRRDVMTRLAVAWATTAAVTLLAVGWGPAFPYRAGKIYPHDIKARVDFQLAGSSNAGPDGDSITVREKHHRGAILVPAGQPIQDRHLELLQAEHEAYLIGLGVDHYWTRGTALFLIFSLLTTMLVLYVARFQPSLAQNLAKIGGVCLLILLTFGLCIAVNVAPWYAVILPLTLLAMVLTLAYNPQFALFLSLSLALGLAAVLGTNLERLLEQVGGAATAILLLRHVRTRSQLVQVGVVAGTVYGVMTVATGVLTNQTWSLIASDAFRHFLWGSLAGFLLTGLLPLVEYCFGIVTDISLLELADGSHPLLQELVKRAPGTYTHSITVATLAEAAAEAIGANPLLVRVGSYFHDVGKMLKPHYFIENQNGANRHDQLEPALSTLVIISHVKDGLALAQEYHLPTPVADFIAQHHGTTLVEYFYREAMRLQENAGRGTQDLETCFRYPGPKPQNRENGIVMLADAVESTSRSLTQPTPAGLQKLVHDLLMKRLLDGQFEESGLTLTELRLIEESLVKSLTALFHARIKYPEPEENSAAA
ncbi:MAG: HDIG domain-containing protein [Gemmataceae bacterium]|nr:HDIG domain-containing protein [Gemmataceae bacterium]